MTTLMDNCTFVTITNMQQRVSELFNIECVSKIDTIIQEPKGYGIINEEDLDNAFYGCYPNVATFCQELLSNRYAEEIEAMPVFLRTAIDWELVWHQSMQKDNFAIYHDDDDDEYYFFKHNNINRRTTNDQTDHT